mmetsp:Transcript_3175/g.19598  ORF Transcript_3175/g.19598 Transcript_3175/m.19598 type:complete len:217 (+) Transcript_3175:771-1421(+)
MERRSHRGGPNQSTRHRYPAWFQTRQDRHGRAVHDGGGLRAEPDLSIHPQDDAAVRPATRAHRHRGRTPTSGLHARLGMGQCDHGTSERITARVLARIGCVHAGHLGSDLEAHARQRGSVVQHSTCLRAPGGMRSVRDDRGHQHSGTGCPRHAHGGRIAHSRSHRLSRSKRRYPGPAGADAWTRGRVGGTRHQHGTLERQLAPVLAQHVGRNENRP